jgi:carbon storage regulator
MASVNQRRRELGGFLGKKRGSPRGPAAAAALRPLRHKPCSEDGQSQPATACSSGVAGRAYTLFEPIDKESVMLVLSRKVGERIHVGDNIILEIRRIAGNRVTLALDAPRNVRILRGELERAAREFRPPESNCQHSTPPAAVAGRVTILNNLPTEPAGRDFAI